MPSLVAWPPIEKMDSASEGIRRRFERSRRLRGDDHPTTVRLREAVITRLEEVGDAASLLPLRKAELASQRRVGGPESLAAFNAGIALGDTLRDLACYEEARRCAEKLLDATTAVAGDDAKATVIAKTMLALTLDDLQEGEELRALCATLIPQATALLGRDHRSVLNVRGCYAAALRRTGDLRAAVAEGRELVADCRRVLGDGDVLTIVSLSHLAGALEDSGSLAEAEPLRREALRGNQRNFPPSHARVWYAQLALADLRFRMGYPDEALELQQSLLASIASGGDPPAQALHHALADAAATQEALGMIEDAAETMHRHIELHVARDGADDETVTRMQSELAALTPKVDYP